MPTGYPASGVRHLQREASRATPARPWGCGPCHAPRRTLSPLSSEGPALPQLLDGEAGQIGVPVFVKLPTAHRPRVPTATPPPHTNFLAPTACCPTAPQAHQIERGTAGNHGEEGPTRRRHHPTVPPGQRPNQRQMPAASQAESPRPQKLPLAGGCGPSRMPHQNPADHRTHAGIRSQPWQGSATLFRGELWGFHRVVAYRAE